MTRPKQEIVPVEMLNPVTVVEREMSALTTRIAQLMPLEGGLPDGDTGQLIAAALMTNPGVPAAEREGWRDNVLAWKAFATEAANPSDGELSIVPALAMVASRGGIVRLHGWPALSSFAQIVRALGPERIRRGVPIIVRRRPSGTPGRSYWVVEIDVAPEIGGDV